MDLMQLRAMAKINLGLDVVRKREDGYHEVRMIMQTIRMFDRVTVYRIPEPEIRISSNLHFLPVNENNIDSVKALAREVVILVDERNKKCRLVK